MKNCIENILSNIDDCISKRNVKKAKLKSLLLDNKDKIVIYGYGNLGQTFSKKLVKSLCIEEENIWFLDTYKLTDKKNHIININDAKEYFNLDILIIVTMYQVEREYNDICFSLNKIGFQNILSIAEFKVWPELLQYGLISCDVEKIQVEKVFQTYELLEDKKSKTAYCEFFQYIISDNSCSLTQDTEDNQYLANDIYSLIEEEYIVDCGAFNGDTMRSLWKQLFPKGWKFYTAFEPDIINREKFKQSIDKDLPFFMRDKVKVIGAAVSDISAQVCFETTGSSASYLVTEKKEGDMVPVVRLDDIIDKKVTFLKMDIEGYEMKALKGAEQLIIKNQPLMAICGYHRLEDLWEIPLYLKKLLPDHKIYLRNYAGVIEYVFYAVPTDRVLKKEHI